MDHVIYRSLTHTRGTNLYFPELYLTQMDYYSFLSTSSALATKHHCSSMTNRNLEYNVLHGDFSFKTAIPGWLYNLILTMRGPHEVNNAKVGKLVVVEIYFCYVGQTDQGLITWPLWQINHCQFANDPQKSPDTIFHSAEYSYLYQRRRP